VTCISHRNRPAKKIRPVRYSKKNEAFLDELFIIKNSGIKAIHANAEI
jgi:hypothetical protein